jgi:pimeloyl-ACP methyl ester carboxylesterase
MVIAIARPKLEGNIAVGDDRQLGFAEFGDPQGRAIFWLHGTPGARRQIPTEARVYAEENHIRLIGIDRPGIGASTPYQYDTVAAFADDLRTVADTLGIDKMAVIGLSGGGPYTLGCAAAGSQVAPLLQVAGFPIRWAAVGLIRLIQPIATTALYAYARVSPEADRRLLVRPEFQAMFLDDLLNGSRKQMAAPFADVIVFARDWGFRLEQVKIPVRWWHGDADHIVPFAHGQHVVGRLPDAELYRLPGESHLAGLGRAEEILHSMVELWDSIEKS